MLVLTRYRGNKIIVGDVTITIIDVIGGKVRVGVEAPPGVPIYRDDLSEGAKRHLGERARRAAADDRPPPPPAA
jgi:carbon storage regulator CsrA